MFLKDMIFFNFQIFYLCIGYLNGYGVCYYFYLMFWVVVLEIWQQCFKEDFLDRWVIIFRCLQLVVIIRLFDLFCFRSNVNGIRLYSFVVFLIFLIKDINFKQLILFLKYEIEIYILYVFQLQIFKKNILVYIYEYIYICIYVYVF